MVILFDILIIRLILAMIPLLNNHVHAAMTTFIQFISPAKPAGIFNDNYINAKQLYMHLFKRIPNIFYVGSIDGRKVLELLQTGVAGNIKSIHQSSFHNWIENGKTIEYSIVRMTEDVLIEIGSEHTQLYFRKDRHPFAQDLVQKLVEFGLPEKSQDFEMNIITQSSQGLELKTLPLKPQSLDINLFYNDDFVEVDTLIRSRLMKENDKGIVLLHGLPGTGKTSYLRHLIGSLKKKVLFVSPSLAGNLMNPELIDLLIENPNSILVIEDAENLILDRKYNSNGSVSNLLNISDGLLSDCLNVQIICTFNSALNTLDSALLRKGRLIARYEFDKLSVGKAIKLSAHLGFDTDILKPMTLAEIVNPKQPGFEQEKVQVIGFRKLEEVLEN